MNATEQGETTTIECNITSTINKEDVDLTTLKADVFNDVTVPEKNRKLTSEAECNNNDNSSFISFRQLLLLFVFFYFKLLIFFK